MLLEAEGSGAEKNPAWGAHVVVNTTTDHTDLEALNAQQ